MYFFVFQKEIEIWNDWIYFQDDHHLENILGLENLNHFNSIM